MAKSVEKPDKKGLFPLKTPFFVELDKKTKNGKVNRLSHKEYNGYLDKLKEGEKNGTGCTERAWAYFRGKVVVCKEHHA